MQLPWGGLPLDQTAPLVVVLAILAFYWWFSHVVLERAVQRVLALPEDRRGGCLARLLVLVGALMLFWMFVLEISTW